jgi:hypothetical protein
VGERVASSHLVPVFVGFLPKLVTADPGWLNAPAVFEICSVSNCVAEVPVASTDAPRTFFDSSRAAREAVATPERRYEIFGYRVWPIGYDEDGEHDSRAPRNALPREPDLSRWERVGYDVVATDDCPDDYYMWCSPLSCNSAARNHEVNRYCLMDSLDAAIDVAREFADRDSTVEPGPYFVVEVLRDPESETAP